MNYIYKKKEKIEFTKRIFFILSFLILLSFSFVQISNAQINLGDNGLEIETFGPTTVTNLREWGILSVVGYIAQIVLGAMIIISVAVLIKEAISFTTDDKDDIKEGIETATGMAFGYGFVLFTLFIYAAFSIFLGIGNIFEWPAKLAQCGGEVLFRAETRAAMMSVESIGEDVLANRVVNYCCHSVDILDEKGEAFVTDFTGINEVGITRSSAIFVGDKESQDAWTFVYDSQNTGAIDSTNAIRRSSLLSYKCEKFPS